MGNDIIYNDPQNFIYAFSDTIGEGRGSNRAKTVINIMSVGSSKVSDPNKGKCLSHGILEGLAWGFLTLLAVCDDFLQYFFPSWYHLVQYP